MYKGITSRIAAAAGRGTGLPRQFANAVRMKIDEFGSVWNAVCWAVESLFALVFLGAVIALTAALSHVLALLEMLWFPQFADLVGSGYAYAGNLFAMAGIAYFAVFTILSKRLETPASYWWSTPLEANIKFFSVTTAIFSIWIIGIGFAGMWCSKSAVGIIGIDLISLTPDLDETYRRFISVGDGLLGVFVGHQGQDAAYSILKRLYDRRVGDSPIGKDANRTGSME